MEQRRIRVRDISRLAPVLRVELDDGVASIFVEVDGEPRVLVTRDRRACGQLSRHLSPTSVPIAVWHNGTKVRFVWGKPGSRIEKQGSRKEVKEEANEVDRLLDAIAEEMDRVWSAIGGFDGSFEHYDWLLEQYGITEEEDVRLQDVIAERERTLEHYYPEEAEYEQIKAFLSDERAVQVFLVGFLEKYQSNTIVYTP